jgi:hypothetical protein
MYRSTHHPRFRASEDGTILFQRKLTWHPIKIRKDGRVRAKIDGKDTNINAAQLVWSAFNDTIVRSFHYNDKNKQNASLDNISPNSWYTRERRYDLADLLLRNPTDTKDIVEELGQDFVDDVLIHGKFNKIIITDMIRRHITYDHKNGKSLVEVMYKFSRCSPTEINKLYTELEHKAEEDPKPFFQSLDNVVGFNDDGEDND